MNTEAFLQKIPPESVEVRVVFPFDYRNHIAEIEEISGGDIIEIKIKSPLIEGFNEEISRLTNELSIKYCQIEILKNEIESLENMVEADRAKYEKIQKNLAELRKVTLII